MDSLEQTIPRLVRGAAARYGEASAVEDGDIQLSFAELADAGVKRISVGSAFARAAFGAFVTAAGEVADRSTFGFADDAIGFAELNRFFSNR